MARKSARTLWLAFVAIGAALAWGMSSVVAGPVLHERFDADPTEDLKYGATTPSGSMPASLQTRSGIVAAPDETQASQRAGARAYGGGHTPTSADANYHIDRLTTRPDRVQYDEPFRPSILPFKRLYAFDRLKKDLSFSVASPELSRISVGGSVTQTEDAFFADFQVDLVAGVPVRIPSVGPGAKIRAFHVDPPQDVEILEDSAENWFARGEMNGRVRMVMQLSIERQVFGSAFRPVTWRALAPHVAPVPEEIRAPAQEVAHHAGVESSDSPARALMTLVDYFRRFKASSDLPSSTNPASLYQELSFSQKGVCRHRSYAFAITALALGLPTRVVHNEAHAWVEVFDTEYWHRVDLGGAATNVQETRPDPLAPNHRPPQDPYSWPQGASSGLGLASQTEAASRQNTASRPPQNPDDPSPHATPDENGTEKNESWPSARQSTVDVDASTPKASRTGADVTLRLGERRLLRGRPLLVSGEATRDGRVCRLSRVDIYVKAPEGLRTIGSVATDERGHFQGHVTLPPTTPVGKLELSAVVAGGCE